MNIIWHYLDKKGAAINALKDYCSMKHIIEHTGEKIAMLNDDMISVGSPALSDLPISSHNPQANENRIITVVEKIDVLKERYSQAVEYMNWFEPAWLSLSEDERYMLEVFYWNTDSSTDAIYDICDKFSIERTSAYNKKNRAVEHLALLLYGK